MRVLMILALLLPVACNGGAGQKRETAAESPAKVPPAKLEVAVAPGVCEQDPECKKDLERLAAGQFSLSIDFLAEIAEYFNRHVSDPDQDTNARELKRIVLPASAHELRLWATNRFGSGACFNLKLVDPATGKTAWGADGLCDVRALGIRDSDTLLLVASLPPEGANPESHAAPHRLQFTYYVWDAQARAFKKTKSLSTREAM